MPNLTKEYCLTRYYLHANLKLARKSRFIVQNFFEKGGEKVQKTKKRYFLNWISYGGGRSEKYYENEMIQTGIHSWEPKLTEKYRIINYDNLQSCMFFAEDDTKAKQIATENIKIIEVSNPLYRPIKDQKGELIELMGDGKKRLVAKLHMKHLEDSRDWFDGEIKIDIHGCDASVESFLEDCKNKHCCPCVGYGR